MDQPGDHSGAPLITDLRSMVLKPNAAGYHHLWSER